MRTIFTSLFLASLLSLGTMTIAQTTEDSASEEAVQPDPADGLAVGEPVPPSPGQTYISGEFGDWEMRCVKAPQGQNDTCSLYQLLIDEAGNQIAEVNLFKLPDGARAAAGATVVVPLETLLTQQLTMSVDGGEPRRYPFTFCNQAGCVSRLGFTQAEVDQFRAGSAAVIRLVPAADPSAEVLVTMSLKGFTAGFGEATPVN